MAEIRQIETRMNHDKQITPPITQTVSNFVSLKVPHEDSSSFRVGTSCIVVFNKQIPIL